MTGARVEKNTQALPLQRTGGVQPLVSVDASVLGKRWMFSQHDDRMAQAISQQHGLPELLGRLLAARGVDSDAVPNFLDPTLKSLMPDPYTLKDMDKAAAAIADAITKGHKVAVFGDYDVDGACSSALLARYFQSLGQNIRIYIPDRLSEGYGPNTAALLKLRNEEKIDVLVTVDCGATAFDPLAEGTAAGLEIVVLDHHRCEPRLPEAVAVVNPNRLDDDSGLGHMAAAGVVFMTLVAVNRQLRQSGWFEKAGKAEPRLISWLDIVALGTVCDVVPLTEINRAFVAQGLKVMALRQNAGLVALSDVAGVDSAPAAFHLGYLLGPRVNAGGRVGEAWLGAKLLSTDDPIEARAIAARLHGYNAERRSIEERVIEEALEAIPAPSEDDLVLIVDGQDWHPGVIGIVAARLKEKYNRPAAVIAFDESGLGKASARSVSGIDLGGAVIAARQQGLLVAGGGHKMAAGFTVARDQLADLRQFMNDHARNQLAGRPLVAELRLDGLLSLNSLQLSLTEMLARLGPYGAGHAEPRFVLPSVRIVRPKVVGESHISCFIQDTAGGSSVKGIAFRALDSALGELLLTSGGAPIHLAGQVSVNEWQGQRSVQFQIADAARIA